MDLLAKFEQTAHTHADKPAFHYFDRNIWKTLTYGEILTQTHRFLLELQACQLTPGMTAAVMTPPSVNFFPFAIALLKFGVIPIILDPAIGLKKVGEILEESQPDIFIGNALTHTIRVFFGWGRNSVKHNLTIESVKSAALNLSKVNPSSIVHHPSSAAAIIYTS
ncbi:partial Olefin beta-lactone synthetase, partial [Anaerolineae bacterium]